MLYSVSMSLDGFIAGAGGDMSWLADFTGPDPTIANLIGDVGSLLVGRNTYDGDDPNKGTEGEGEAFGGGWSGQQFVLTHRIPENSPPDIHFVDDFETAVAKSKAAAGEKYVNILGADVARQCVAAGLVDEVLVFLVPVLIGDGVRLFDHPGGTSIRLERLSVSEGPESTNLWFRVVR
nr:dihydrofolate reductase family protein [Actinoalloteichus hymeniacidonis]